MFSSLCGQVIHHFSIVISKIKRRQDVSQCFVCTNSCKSLVVTPENHSKQFLISSIFSLPLARAEDVTGQKKKKCR